MANEQHIEWLLEGVEAWNARREKDGFVPDFTGADLKSIHLNGGAVVRRGGIGTSGQLHHVNFQKAFLIKANLSECILSNGKLNYANMTDATIRGGLYDHTDFRGAVTTDVDASTKLYTNRPNEPTDLGMALNLTQHQLNSMKGDSGTIIPEGLERPAHWPELEKALPELVDEDDITDGNHTEPASQAANQIALQDQVSVILAAPVKHAAAAELLNDQLDSAIRMFRAANPTNEQPDDLILVERFSDKIREIRTVLDQPGETQAQGLETRLPELLAIIDNLRATIEDQAKEIEDLKAQKPERTDYQKMRSAFAEKFGATLGTGTASTLLAGSGYLLGQYGNDALLLLRGAFSDLFSVAPAAPPPPQLPPTTPT
jgi:hypothetical protein